MQIRKRGKIVVPHYEVNAPNETIDYGSHTGIVLKNRYGEINGEALVDKCNALDVLQYKWHKTKSGYVARRNSANPGLFFLHWHIIERQDGMVVDHVNGNKQDNRIDNLRLCTNQENTFNAKISKNNTSGVHGVSFHKKTGKWRAYINHNRKQIYLGLFSSIEDAKYARVKAELEYHKEFSAFCSQGNGANNERTIFDSASP